jgi:hypothetical protein
MRRVLNATGLVGGIVCVSMAAIITLDTGVDIDVITITPLSLAAIAYSLWSLIYDHD